MWILVLAKLLYKVPLPFTSTLAKHLHIPIRSHIFQCQCAIRCYLLFQITIGGREIPTRGNTMPDCGRSWTFVWTSPTLCTMISCNSERLLLIASHSHYHNKTCTNMSVQWQKNKKKNKKKKKKKKRKNNLMILCRSRYHMLQLAEELAAATNQQLTPTKRNNVLNYEDYLSKWMPMWYVCFV